ncbi:NepR family anti-sigma factor [Hyphomonas sp.]
MRRGVKLGEALREAYASILAESCPDSMLKLLEQLRAEEAQRQNTED